LHLARRVSAVETPEGSTAGGGGAQRTVVGVVPDVEEVRLKFEGTALHQREELAQRSIGLLKPREHHLTHACVAEGTVWWSGEGSRKSGVIQRVRKPLAQVSRQRAAGSFVVELRSLVVVGAAGAERSGSGIHRIKSTCLRADDEGDQEAPYTLPQ
jgi:hypothetical protein